MLAAEQRAKSVTRLPRWCRSLSVLVGLSVACGHSEDRPDCRDNAFHQVADGIPGPVSPTGRRVAHYRVPRTELQLHDIAVAPDGVVWYADMLNSCIGKLNPGTGRFSEYSTASGGANPHGVTVDSAGTVWYAASQHGRVGRIDPATGHSREFALPKEIRGVHTVFAHAGRIWFTSSLWGSLDPNTGDVQTYENRFELVTASDAAVWIGLRASDPLIRFSFDTISTDRRSTAPDAWQRDYGGATDHWLWWRLPTPDARPHPIARDRAGRIWYTDRDRSMIGLLDPGSAQGREFPTANERAFVDDLAVDPEGIVWFYEVRTGSLVGLDPAAGTYEFVEIGVPDAGVSHVTVDPVRGHVWLALVDTDGGALARLEAVR